MKAIRAWSSETWLHTHGRVARESLRRMRLHLLGSVVTIVMMGCALSLPVSLWILTDNAASAGQDWKKDFSVSLYLSDGISTQQGRDLLQSLLKEPTMARGNYLSPDDAMAEFREYSGFGRALDLLDENPLPAVLVLWPAADISPASLEQWLAQQRTRPEIRLAQADASWLERLQALVEFGQSLVRIMGLLLVLTVLLVVANTIRLDIENRREEILVMKLIGAPDGFIQRPFLYSGSLYGLLSGFVACVSVAVILQLVHPHIAALAASYDKRMVVEGLGLSLCLKLILAGGVMGWAGAWHSVWRNLRDIEPE